MQQVRFVSLKVERPYHPSGGWWGGGQPVGGGGDGKWWGVLHDNDDADVTP